MRYACGEKRFLSRGPTVFSSRPQFRSISHSFARCIDCAWWGPFSPRLRPHPHGLVHLSLDLARGGGDAPSIAKRVPFMSANRSNHNKDGFRFSVDLIGPKRDRFIFNCGAFQKTRPGTKITVPANKKKFWPSSGDSRKSELAEGKFKGMFDPYLKDTFPWTQRRREKYPPFRTL